MTESSLATICYEGQNRQVAWRGVVLAEGYEFDTFLTNDVSSRLYDQEGHDEFENDLRGVVSTGFARDSLNAFLAAEVQEERDWAIGEAMAEAYLTREHAVTWPWNTERDKRNPNASLPGADLVGFTTKDDYTWLTLGEVKCSSDMNTPPGVMNGRSGMTHQIDNLATDLGLLCQLLKWLHPRCKGTDHESMFISAASGFFRSGNKAIWFFGVLIRDTAPNQFDLQARGQSLGGNLQNPTKCNLIALYLPCAIADLPSRMSGGES